MSLTQSTERLHQLQEELQDILREISPSDGNMQLSNRLAVFRRASPSDMNHGESSLALCMIASGSKQVLLGDDLYNYDKDHYFITSMQLPTASSVIHATTQEPYLALRLELDPTMVKSVLMSAPNGSYSTDVESAFNVSKVDADLVNAVTRLLRASQSENDAAILMPLIEQEIVYRLLKGNQGARLAQIAGFGTASGGISAAISRMRSEYDQPLRIPDLAREIGMSVSSFHDHFKRSTGLTPLQFQKHLRLREARRLLLGGDCDVAEAGYQVGYADASHFNREYKRMFGEPPLRDLNRVRAAGPLAQTGS